MLEIVRNLVSSIFGKILLGLMVLSFALWGVGDILSSGNSKLAAKVGSQKISLEEFYNKLGRKVQELNLSTGNQLTIQEAHEQNIDKFVINDLVYEKMVLEFANTNKIYINDNILKDTIKNLPQFTGADGNFSEQLYRNAIKNRFSSEEEFLNELTFIYVNSLLFENFKLGEMTNQKIIDLLYEYEGEERSVNYFLFNKENIKVNSSKDEYDEYYNKNSLNYFSQEERTIEYIKISLDDYKKLIQISNDTVLNYYNENKDLFFTEEKRNVELTRFEDEGNADSFSKIWSQSNSEQIESYIQENNITINNIDDLSKNSFEANVTNEIFKLQKDAVSKPIKISDAGFYVVKVTNISPEIQEAYESVRKSIIEEMSFNEAYDLFDQALNLADDLLLSGYELVDIVENLDLESIINSDQEIIKISGLNKFVDEHGNIEMFLDAYEQNVGYISEIIIDNQNAYIYKIKDVKEPYLKDYDLVKEQVKKDLENYKKEIILEEAANEFLINYQFKNHDEFKKYANSNKLELISINNIKRNNNHLNLEKSTIDKIFSMNKNNILKFKDTNNNIGVIYIKDVISPKDKISNEFYNQALNNIKLNFDLSIENILGETIIEESEYEIFLQNINNIFS